MKEDMVLKLLRQVKSGEVSIEDAQSALEGVNLSEEAYESAVNHGVFNEPAPGTIVRASIRPSGESFLVVLIGLWGFFGHCTGQVRCLTGFSTTGINNFYPFS